jgi:D-3-phosphoglycerate dehydrogenase
MPFKVAYAALPVLLNSGSLDLERAYLTPVDAAMEQETYPNEEELITHAADADGILDFGIPISRKGLTALTKCRGIVLTGHGFNHIDLEAATELGIPVANVYFCHEEVATHSMLLLLAVARKLTVTHNELLEGRWRRDLLVGIPPINGQTLGLIGLGHIGRAMARSADSGLQSAIDAGGAFAGRH